MLKWLWVRIMMYTLMMNEVERIADQSRYDRLRK